jgi:hypothetical protein
MRLSSFGSNAPIAEIHAPKKARRQRMRILPCESLIECEASADNRTSVLKGSGGTPDSWSMDLFSLTSREGCSLPEVLL